MRELNPLVYRREGDQLEFGLCADCEILPELPLDFEQTLNRHIGPILAEKTALQVTINLVNRTAISSRELGALIALAKVMRPRFEKVPIVGLSPAVRSLLKLTRTDQLFISSENDA
jgi:anti-anti-sigma regulatory factor